MTREEIISLYKNGMTQKEIAKSTGITFDRVNTVIAQYNSAIREEFLRSQMAVTREPVIFRVEYAGKEYTDITDLYTDRPCICREPIREDME